MPIAKFEMPDGRIGRFEVPEGTTPEQAQQMISQFVSGKESAKVKEEPAAKGKSAIDYGAEFLAGVTSLPRGALNLVSEGLGERIWPSAGIEKGAAYTAGQILDPLAWTVGGAGMKAAQAAQALPKVGAAIARSPVAQGMLGGAAGGTAIGALGEDTTALESGMLGGAIGGVIPVAGRAIGGAIDRFGGTTAALRAKKVIEDVAGERLPQIRALWQRAPEGVTASQAAAPAESTTLAALGERAAKMQSQYYDDLARAQEASRRSTLQNVSPNLQEMEEVRKVVSDINYGRAYASDRMRREAEKMASGIGVAERQGLMGERIATDIPRIPELKAIESNPIIKAAEREAKILIGSDPALAHLSGKNPMDSLEGLHVMKMAIDNQFRDRSAKTALQKYSESALNLTRDRLLGAMNKLSPLYTQARERFSEMSAPVNQAKVMQELSAALEGPTGREKAARFMNVMGQGEKTLLRRANQQPRFGGIEDVLNEKQLAARNQVLSELERDASLAERASAGAQELGQILMKDAVKYKIPAFLNWKATTANQMLGAMEEVLNRKTMNAVYTAMRSGKDAEAIMSVVPARERIKIIRALYNNQAVPFAMGATQVAGEEE